MEIMVFLGMAWQMQNYKQGDGEEAANWTTTICPSNSWPDNANLDKARNYYGLSNKYGQKISWADQ